MRGDLTLKIDASAVVEAVRRAIAEIEERYPLLATAPDAPLNPITVRPHLGPPIPCTTTTTADAPPPHPVNQIEDEVSAWLAAIKARCTALGLEPHYGWAAALRLIDLEGLSPTKAGRVLVRERGRMGRS